MNDTRAGWSEYDRFGPWIDQVKAREEIPPLYRDHPLDLDATRLVLKVPRNIDRRDATPGMDLYDHLAYLDEEGLTVLSRRIESSSRKVTVVRGYDVTSMPYPDVAAVLHTENLLDNRLTVFTRDGMSLSFRYNASGRDSVGRLIATLRAEFAALTPTAIGARLSETAARLPRPTETDLEETDPVFVYGIEEIAREHDGVVPWTCHARTPAVPRDDGLVGAFHKLTHAIAPVTLHGGIVAGDGVAVEVVGRREWLIRSRNAVYSRSRLTIPFGALEGIEIAAHDRYVGASVVRFVAGAARNEIVVPDSSSAFALFSEVRAVGVGAIRGRRA